MSGNIYLINNNGELAEMIEQSYDSEDLLQELLAKYPNLLAGDQINNLAPRKWLLISREMAIPSEEEGGGRWSLDHLFLDQDAIPTLVEVKRSTDTRIRREVVGQLLDYAANAVLYWPVEKIRAEFESRCEQMGISPEVELTQLLGQDMGQDMDQEGFWSQVKTNLQAGKIRMIFISDEIPSELRRIVEFLNGQMDPAEVLALEIKQYIGKGVKSLVPRVIGRTEKAEFAKNSARSQGKQWNEKSFLEDLEGRGLGKEAIVAKKILDWAIANNLRIWWGKGNKDGSFFPMLDHGGEDFFLFSVRSSGLIKIQFQWMKQRPVFDDETMRLELLNKLNKIPGIDIPSDSLGHRPGISISTLFNETNLKEFLQIFDWYIFEIKRAIP